MENLTITKDVEIASKTSRLLAFLIDYLIIQTILFSYIYFIEDITFWNYLDKEFDLFDTLTGTLIADIFLGKITKWNDPAIAALNPTLSLPSQDITVVRRADGSGTTFIWTNYLSKVSKEFKDTIGEGTAVNWKVGAGGKGNEGVAQMVRQLPGAFGYVEFAYVKQTKMNWVQIQNAAGTWVSPTEDTFKAAAANADWNKTYYQILTNQAGKEAWPISGATFILVYATPAKPADSKASLAFFDWAFTNGDKAADELDYVALPATVKAKIRADWKRLGLF